MLIAILGGLAAAVCWTIAAVCAAGSSREIGASSTLSYVMGFGLVIVIVPLALAGRTSSLPAHAIVLLCVAGVSNVLGLRLEYVAVRHLPVGIVAAIASTEGILAAVIAFFFGASLQTATVVLLAVISLGIMLAAAHLEPGDAVLNKATSQFSGEDPDEPAIAAPRRRLRYTSRTRWTLLVLPVALLFAGTLYTTGRAGTEVPLIFVMSTARVFGTVFVTVPSAVRRRLRLTRRSLPLVVASGAAEVVGVLAYAAGARHNLAVAAVFGAQFAALTPIAALVFFKERLQMHQVAGIGLIVIGVVIFSALSG